MQSDDRDSMVPMYGLSLTGPSPTRIADLSSMADDLRFAASMFERLIDADTEADPDLARAFYDAGVMAYRRSFTGGRALLQPGASRTRVPDQVIEQLSDAQREIHETLLAHANTHVGHRVSDLEQRRVVLLLNNPSLGKSVQAVICWGPRLHIPAPAMVATAHDVAAQLSEELARLMRAEQQQLLTAAKAQDIGDLYRDARPLGDEPPTS